MNEKRIDEYIRYFTGKLDSVLELEDSKKGSPDKSIIMFKKTLVVAILDALSKIIYGGSEKSWKRFVDFLMVFTDWPDGTKLSTTHLYRALELDLHPNLESLRLYVRQQLDTWGPSTEKIRLDNDIEAKELKKRWPKGAEHSIAGIKIDQYNHFNLVYVFRCALIHEFRELGFGTEDSGSTKPYYHTKNKLGSADEKVDSWELVYPLDFLVSLARTALGNLDEYLKRNDLNPDRHFRFGSYFFDKMNPEIL